MNTYEIYKFFIVIVSFIMIFKGIILEPCPEPFTQPEPETFFSKKVEVEKLKPFQDKTFLINLDKRPDRLKHFEKSLKQSDIPNEYSRISAVVGSELNLDNELISMRARQDLLDLDKTGHRTRHYQLTRGAIGCYKSHIKTWYAILEDPKIKSGLIFEDDTTIPSNLQSIINKKVEKAPKDWDIILLGVSCNKCSGIPANNSFLRVNRFFLLHSYIISRKGIKKILSTGKMFPIAQQIDSALSDISGIVNIYALRSNPVKQAGFGTNIQAPLKQDKEKGTGDKTEWRSYEDDNNGNQ